MTQTGGADRPGLAPNAERETQKRGVVRQALQGLHGPLLLGCGQGLAPQGSSANEGRFRQFMPEISTTQDPSDRHACQPRPGSAPRCIRAPSSPSPPPLPAASSERGAPSPAHPQAPPRHLAFGAAQVRASRGLQSRPPQWSLSARVWRDPAKLGSHRRPRHSPRRWPASAHRGRSRAARS